MNRFVFLLTSGPEHASNVTRCFQFARLAAEQGNDVLIFMVDDAVYNGTQTLERLQAITGDSASDHFKAILEGNLPVRIKVCKPCSAARNIDATDLLPTVAFGSGPELVKDMVGSTVVTL